MLISMIKNPDGSRATILCDSMTFMEGWAYLPDEMLVPDTFPYVDIETEEIFYPAVTEEEIVIIDGEEKIEVKEIYPAHSRVEVVSISESFPTPGYKEPILRTSQDDIDAMTIDHEYRLTLLELGLNE